MTTVVHHQGNGRITIDRRSFLIDGRSSPLAMRIVPLRDGGITAPSMPIPHSSTPSGAKRPSRLNIATERK